MKFEYSFSFPFISSFVLWWNVSMCSNVNVSETLCHMLCCRFINIVDAEKCGLPRVLDTIEVSCKTRHNIKLLCNLIYDTVFSLRPPGNVFCHIWQW
jgi:hypothetical protein